MELLVMMVLAFCGGVFGAFIGGVTAFVLCGLLGIVGIGIILAGGSDMFLWQIAFGPLFGPHVAFSAGVAAIAYWGQKSKKLVAAAPPEKKEAVEGRALNGTNTLAALMVTQDVGVLLVGGIFGVIGFSISHFLSKIGLAADNAAIAVTVCGILSRLIFGKSGLTGDFATGERRYTFSWQKLLFDMMWSFSLAALIAQIVQLTEINVFGFVVGAFSLIFLYFGFPFPPFHHVAMVAGFAVVAFNNIWIAAIFGMIAMLVGEIIQQTFNTKVDSHIDMPAFTIAVLSLVILNIF